MRALLQRVRRAQVLVEGTEVGSIGQGWAVLLGVKAGDTLADAARLARKVAHLRAFEDEQGKMNLSALDAGAEALVVSQFTLYADTQRGRRPSFVDAAAPDVASPLVDYFVETLRGCGMPVATGLFGARMEVLLHNYGPVTFLLSTD